MLCTRSSLAFACYSKACAPPPVGRGGSDTGGSVGVNVSAALKRLFPYDEPQVIAPWPKTGRTKGKPLFDPQKVVDAVTNPKLTDVDPKGLKSTQPWITRAGVEYYLKSDYERTGKVFADADKPTNRYPVILRRANGDLVILSGHHRAAAALATDRPLRAVLVDE